MAINKFELQGRVGYIKIDYVANEETGKTTVYTTVGLGVKKNENGNNWDNFFITFFNRRKTAEILADSVKKGDYIRVVGRLSESRYLNPKYSDEERSETRLIGFGYKKQEYDEMAQEWVDV